MDAVFSIRLPFTDMIFDGRKNLEFRNKIGQELFAGNKIYIYETKKHSGKGAVIGSVVIENIEDLPHHKAGTYNLLPHFVERYGTKEEKDAVRKAMGIRLTHYDESIVLSHLFNDRVLDYMIEHDDVPDPRTFPPFYGYTAKEFNQIKEKGDGLIFRCDQWLHSIGYYTETGCTYWKYMIQIKDQKRFKEPKNITEFLKRDGRPLKKAPQSWCYASPKI